MLEKQLNINPQQDAVFRTMNMIFQCMNKRTTT